MICQSRRRRTFRFFSWMYHFWQQTQSGRRFYMCIPSLFITWNIKYTCVNSYPQPVQCCDVSSSVTEKAVVTLPVGPVAKIQLRIFFPLSGHAAILIHQVYYGFLDICPEIWEGLRFLRNYLMTIFPKLHPRVDDEHLKFIYLHCNNYMTRTKYIIQLNV